MSNEKQTAISRSWPPMTRDQVRQVDRVAIGQYGINGLVLMENAGREAARWIAEHAPAGEVCLLCGKGNNAGDGYVIARHLQMAFSPRGGEYASRAVANRLRVISLVDPQQLSGDAAVNHRIAAQCEIQIDVATDPESLRAQWGQPGTIVDCLLGTGASGDPRGVLATAITMANATAAWRVAIDLPSGLDCDSGEAGQPTFQADATLTFVAPKIGLLQPSAASLVGHLEVLPIGVPEPLLRRLTSQGDAT